MFSCYAMLGQISSC